MSDAGCQRTEQRNDAAIQRWRAHRLGQFIHFGLYSIPAGTWKGQTVEYAAEFLPNRANVRPAEWNELAKEFSLPAFDPKEWAQVAKNAGAGYVTMTTKHHEGFSLWPSELTDFHIGNTPFGRDWVGELVKAYNDEGIDVVLYYSVLDWNHPDWRYEEKTEEDKAAGVRYRAWALAQVLELAKRYPTIIGFWFDGTWDDSIKYNGQWTLDVENAIKDAIDGAIVNSRLRADIWGNRHIDGNGKLMGDFESGYERRLPDPWDTEVVKRDWEACMTISEWTWGYHSGQWATSSIKDYRDILDQLTHTVSLNGNFLLNVGPRGDGSHNPTDVETTAKVGKWVAAHVDAIRGAGHESRMTAPKWGYYTRARDTTTHAIVTRLPFSKRVVLTAPGDKGFEDIQIDPAVEAKTITLADNSVQIDVLSSPTEPFTISFSLKDIVPNVDVNPDVKP